MSEETLYLKYIIIFEHLWPFCCLISRHKSAIISFLDLFAYANQHNLCLLLGYYVYCLFPFMFSPWLICLLYLALCLHFGYLYLLGFMLFIYVYFLIIMFKCLFNYFLSTMFHVFMFTSSLLLNVLLYCFSMFISYLLCLLSWTLLIYITF